MNSQVSQIIRSMTRFMIFRTRWILLQISIPDDKHKIFTASLSTLVKSVNVSIVHRLVHETL